MMKGLGSARNLKSPMPTTLRKYLSLVFCPWFFQVFVLSEFASEVDFMAIKAIMAILWNWKRPVLPAPRMRFLV